MGTTMSLDFQGSTDFAARGRTCIVRERLSAALRRATADMRSPAKQIARIAGCTPKAAQRWLDADNAMTVESLALLAQHFDEVFSEWLALCGREPADAEAMIDRFQEMLRERRRVK